MALETGLGLDSGIILEKSYHRITGVDFRLDENSVSIFVAIYRDEQARLDGNEPVNVLDFRFEFNEKKDEEGDTAFDQFFTIEDLSAEGSNIISQAYEYIKTLPYYSEYEDLKDV